LESLLFKEKGIELDQYKAAGGNRDNKFEAGGLFLALAQEFSKNRINTAIFLRGI